MNVNKCYMHAQVGGFTFQGHFTWVDVPEREKKRRGTEISPTWWVILKDTFWHVDQMQGL